MLEISKLSIGYEKEILYIDYLCLNKGLYVIKGVSGSGKTSLFNCIDNKMKYDGVINVEGSVCVYYQNNILIDEFSLSDFKLIDKNIDLKIYYHLLIKFDLLNKENIKSKYLSKGEKQRAELLILFSLNKDIYLLDEPCSSLNKKYKNILYKYMNSIKKDKLVLMNSHDAIEASFEIVNGNLECRNFVFNNTYDEVVSKNDNKNKKVSYCLLKGLYFNKLQTLINVTNVSISFSMFLLSFKLDDIILSGVKEYKELINNCFIKMGDLFDGIRFIVFVVFISSISMYMLSFVNEAMVNNKKIRNLIDYFGSKFIVKHFILKISIEIIVIVVVGVILFFIFMDKLRLMSVCS